MLLLVLTSRAGYLLLRTPIQIINISNRYNNPIAIKCYIIRTKTYTKGQCQQNPLPVSVAVGRVLRKQLEASSENHDSLPLTFSPLVPNPLSHLFYFLPLIFELHFLLRLLT